MSDNNIPNHVAVIMDGNGRWAKKRGMPRSLGHKKGLEAVELAIESARKTGVTVLSLFAFSTENWNRDSKEIDFLFNAFVDYLKKKKSSLIKNDICLVVSGRRDNLPQILKDTILDVETATRENKSFILNIAFNYGGRAEILDAAKKLAQVISADDLDVDKLTEEDFSSFLYNSKVPDVDLMIRTSGEQRISNFLLWRLAYSEFYFTEQLWPDFDEDSFRKALKVYAGRKRRFGVES